MNCRYLGQWKEKKKPPVVRAAGLLCGDSVGALAGIILCGLDTKSHLLRDCSADKTADRVILPVGRIWGTVASSKATETLVQV
jgi:hypothetical protein